ncbi:Cupredoxin [Aspergillus bertholletiae]|uniref:Cupredoxin n=1 Tax=Aspergillus bertholletiae TaxID=1226010 RepID=A0A5N7BFN7_9EURO|nr:Cupredoxin [Aspergillus bertholletiae]
MTPFHCRLSLLAFLCLVHWVSCKAVQFELNLTWETHEVAGATRKMILSNGQFPSPTLRLKQGDRVEFLVNNSMPFGATVHFHGIEQRGTPWSDGVPGLSQRQIAPGDQYLYTWTATDYGAYIYHAHTRSQIEDGLYGAIYIQPDDSVERPFHLIADDAEKLRAMHKAEMETDPIILSDWRHLTSEEIWQAQVASGIENFCANAVLINGKGSVLCLPQDRINELSTAAQRPLTDMGCLPPSDPRNISLTPNGFLRGCTPSQGPTEIFEVESASQYKSWDLINIAGSLELAFSIDQHPFYVYAIDGHYIEPIHADAVTIPIGGRYSILVELDQPAGEYAIRAANTGANQIINGTGFMRYEASTSNQRNLSQPSITETGSNATANTVFLDETSVVPFPVEVPSSDVDRTYILNVEHFGDSYHWTLGNHSFPQSNEEATPLLLNRSSIPTKYTITTLNNTWVDLIINVTTGGQPPHPIHKHSNKYFVIGSGSGAFHHHSVAEAVKDMPESFNFHTPQMRDTFFTPPAGAGPSWLAIRYNVVNPGPFLLHCHIQPHLSGGMALAILDGVDAWPDVPDGYELPSVAN